MLKKLKASHRPISRWMKYQLNKPWFNVKFPNQLFKLEEKSNDFFYNLWLKNGSKMLVYEKKEDTGTHTI